MTAPAHLPAPPTRPPSGRLRRRRTAVALAAVVALGGGATGIAAASGSFGSAQVGSDGGAGVLLPDNQRVTPVGTRHFAPDGRLLSSTLSPDGTKIAALTWTIDVGRLSIIDASTGAVLQQVGLGSSGTDGDGTVSPDGPLYSPDGSTLWFSQTKDILRFSVLPNGTVNPNPTQIALTDAHGNADLPSGMALSPDGSLLYVALNGANTLGVIDTTTNTLVKQIPVGNAPRQVVITGGKAYVSNEGGRPARHDDFTNLSDGTPIVADPSTGAATTGTVSVVDLATDTVTKSINVGLQPTAEYLGADGTLFVANSNDDSMSLIDTSHDEAVQTVNVNPLPGSTEGSYPTSIVMSDPHTLLVAIGRDNAIAEYRYEDIHSPLSYLGLIPTDWYPDTVQFDKATGQIVVTNDKGIGSRGPAGEATVTAGQSPTAAYNTYLDTGTITEFDPQSSEDLSADTHQVFVDNAWDQLLAKEKPIDQPHEVPVPTQDGQVSPIKHVFLIVKENRTYDQVLGDLGKGNGDPAETEFGQAVTPNQHQLATTFGDFDNFYDEGTLSADGHNWLVQADANDYIEREFGAFYRSYPAQGGDALAYQRSGFIWNDATDSANSAADFGEYNNFITLGSKPPTWSQWFHDSEVLEGKATGPLDIPIGSKPTYADIPSLNAIDDHAYPMFDLDIPDQYRVDIWKQAFDQALADNKVANLNLLWVPDDHTSTSPEDPNAVASVADNDLAVGRIVDTISHSSIWSSSAIFIVEDDPQNGVDHVDGHRSTFYLVSPYAKRGVVDSTYYTQLNIVRTIEDILNMAPMNQEDRAAVPMLDAFTDTPDLTPYSDVSNDIPLNLGVDPTQAGYEPGAGEPSSGSTSAAELARLATPTSDMALIAAWQAWGANQHFGGLHPIADFANPEQLNRYDWYIATGWSRPYPGDRVIYLPNQVPGAQLPASFLGDG